MHIRKSIRTFLATAFAAAAVSAAARAENADIYEIRACDDKGVAVDQPVTTIDAPMEAGRTARFVVRFASREGVLGGSFYLKHTGPDSEILDDALSPLMIGVYVSGEARWAKLVGRFVPVRGTSTYDQFYDCVFEYETKPGDFALPIVLATANGPAKDAYEAGAEYSLLNADKWKVMYKAADGTETEAVWLITQTTPQGVKPIDVTRECDYSLAKAGFHVQTVDFKDRTDKTAWATETAWKTVPERTTVTAQIRATSVLTNATDLYVWSQDESAVKVAGDLQVRMIVGSEHGEPKYADTPTSVAKVTIVGGAIASEFKIQGVARGKTANLVLSAWSNYTWSASLATTGAVDYVTVPVACVEPPPPEVTVTQPYGEDTFTVGADYQTALTELTVALSEAYTDETATVKVTLTPSVRHPECTTDWSKYVSMSEKTDATAWTTTGPITLSFTAGQTAKTAYLYGLGADRYTGTAEGGLNFTITDIEPAAACEYYQQTFVSQNKALLYFVAAPPAVTSPEAYAEFEAQGGFPRTFEIAVSDNYKNVTDSETYYNLEWCKQGDKDLKVLTDDDGNALRFWIDTANGNILKRVAADGTKTDELPSYTYVTPGTYSSAFRVKAPNGTQSEVVRVTVKVSEPPTISLTTTNLGETDECYEGTVIAAHVELSSPNDSASPIYAFLKPVDETTNYVDATWLAKKGCSGLKILAGASAPKSDGAIRTLDGRAEKLGGTALDFEVVLCSSQKYDENKIISGYQSETLTVRCYNVDPTLAKVTMNGTYSVSENGATMKGSAAKDASKTFTFEVDDPGIYDLTATGDESFQLRWRVIEANGASDSNVILGNPNATNFTYTFTSAGQAEITVELMDKDMKEYPGKFGTPFTFYVNVTDRPTAAVESESGEFFSEDMVGAKNGRLKVVLSDRNTSGKDLRVRLTVTANAGTDKPGLLKLGNCEFVGETETTRTYELNYPNGQDQVYIYIDEADGTKNSINKGFDILAEVTTESLNPDKIRWCDYYQKQTFTLLMENVAPTLVCSLGAQNTATNAFTAAIGFADPVTYSVDDAAPADLAAGLTVVWWSTDTGAADPVTVTDSSKEYTYTPEFKSAGTKIVRCTVTDKDKDSGTGTRTREWYYEVQAAKSLVVAAHGPSSGWAATPAYATKYTKAGEGHVWNEEGYAFSKASNWKLTWNCGVNSAATMYGWGYKVAAPEDNGTLDSGNDIALDATGYSDGKVTANFYRYSETGLDSFLYTWLSYSANENGSGMTCARATGIVAEKNGPTRATSRSTPVLAALPSEKGQDDASYAVTYLEAVFAKEYLPSDDMGDINQDGIPDAYVQEYKFGVVSDDGAIEGDDMKSLATFNDDADTLPLSDAMLDTTKDENINFTADLEIRGWDAHLNDAPAQVGLTGYVPVRRYLDPSADPENSTLSPLEFWAYTNYCAKVGADWKSPDSYLLWSPENPTDPTIDDTDDDGVNDGYEYWYWYRAHVGYEFGGSFVKLTGRRYRADRPAEPDLISSEDIATAYNPTVKNADFATLDTDNDGICDLEEIALGTNPFDCDTDGDGVADGFEVTISETDPLLSDCDANPDGDAMAFVEMKYSVLPVLDADGVHTNFVCSSGEIVTNDAGKIDVKASGRCFAAWKYTYGGDLCRGFEYASPEQKAALADATVAGVVEKKAVWLMHFHVFEELGFDPRTGWNASPYWTGDMSHVAMTRDFSTRDEFLLLSFYINDAGLAVADATPSKNNTMLNLWSKLTTNPLSADTDADGMPDGWEAYLQTGPIAYDATGARAYGYGHGPVRPDGAAATENAFSPLMSYALVASYAFTNTDGDGLAWPAEYSGVETADEYAGKCDSITLVSEQWQNKWWATDPWNPDTDGDGLTDPEESGAFAYGSAKNSVNWESVIPGGGLNPCSWDTDRDGLPDPWELGFRGSASTTAGTTTTSVSSDGSSTNTVTTAGSATWNDDGMDGTVSDAKKDYDHDGLLNWQEYMVAAMRCWRYDDTFSCWSNQTTRAMDAFTDEDWYATLVNPDSGRYNPGLWDSHFNPGNYFEPATNAFEQTGSDQRVMGQFYMFADGVGHARAAAWAEKAALYGVNPPKATDYPSCDPRLADTDGDGMDDYYELFHGLNPLLGAVVPTIIDVGSTVAYSPSGMRDIVAECWAKNNDGVFTFTAGENYWTEIGADGTLVHPPRPDVPLRYKNADKDWYDFFQWPWFAGLAYADADGDNIRNQQEAIFANVQAASTYLHLDPSALWMTDSSDPDSLTYRYYQMYNPRYARTAVIHPQSDSFTHGGVTYRFSDFPWLTLDGGELTSSFAIGCTGKWDGNWHNLDVMFSFEENEGYDSDHDFLGDFEEAQGKTKTASDPQDHDDPLRRQAMWFGGADNPGFLQTPLAFEERTANFSSASETRQNFLYYTVECWAKPDAATYQNEELQTLVERAIYTGISGPADESFLRKNFLIGLKGGRWYTKFDSTGTDAKQSVEILEGPAVSTNWTHVAATYDGEALKLYVNGALVCKKPTSIQPEHGVAALSLTEAGEMNSQKLVYTTEGDGRYPYYKFISILVGASAMDANGIVCDLAWKNRSMDYATVANPLGVSPLAVTTIADYGKFYRGYIDEVRIWDGARTAADIKNDYENLVRYTTALASENRQDVYSVWAANGGGGTRAPVTGMTELPAQLMYHWAFDHIAGAVEAQDVAKVPAGFATTGTVTDAKAIWTRPLNWQNNWYATLDNSIRSTVYTDLASVPWINNTVAHLPRLDTTTLDSFYWSEDYAGATLASDYGYAKFAFSRTHELPSRWTQQIYDASSDIYSTDTRWNVINAGTNVADSVLLTHRFARRDRDTVGSDLMIFGGAFPKRISSTEGGLWDEQGAADAWAQTGDDTYHDGLPDWWRAYAEENYLIGEPGSKITWDTTVDYNGLEMSAGEAYKRDLAKGMLPDAEYHDEYADTRDADADSIPDWWEEMYGVQGNDSSDADADPDNDGLSNYAEYVLSEVYTTAFDAQLSALGDYRHIALNPTMMYSQLGQTVPDYYLAFSAENKVIQTDAGKHFKANEYFGEIVTDHDFMEDWWENKFSIDYTSSKKYDPLADADGDGWSTYAECRASLWGGYFNANLIDYWTGTESDQNVVCRPQPIVAVKATYYGVQDISGKPLVVRTISGQRSRVDATFVVPAELSSQTRYIGPFVADTTLRGHMSPGILNVNSVVFERAAMSSDKTYQWNCDWYQENTPDEVGWESPQTWIGGSRVHSGSFDTYRTEYAKWPKIELEGGDLTWETFAEVLQSSDLQSATVMINGATKFGTVNGVTGEYELDMSKFTGTSGTTVGDYVFRVTYTSRIGHEWPQTVYLSDTRELATGDGASLNGSGFVREGANTVEAFIDLDGDGAYTVGEPFGIVQNVQIGWHKTPVAVIELKDTSHVVSRYDLASGTDDRAVVIGTTTEKSEAGTTTEGEAAEGEASSEGLTAKIVIRRKTINGQARIQTGEGMSKSVPVRSLVTKTIILDDHAYLTEADVIGSGKYDLDWKWLVKDAEKLGLAREDLKTAGYDIEQVKTLADGSTTNVVLFSFSNEFNTQRAKPVAVSPVNEAPVYSSSPAIRFTSSDETMTAYKLQIRRAGDNKVIFEEQDILPGRIPSTVGTAAYEVTPAVYAGAPVTTSKGEIFADGTNYEWRVALYNAKFNADEESAWSDWASFQMDLANEKRYPKIPTGYGNAAVCVRYYGIATNDVSKTVVVEAFENADFAGQPLAQIRVSPTNALHSITDIKTPNAVLRGIKPGTVYLRAYLDLNDNGQRDSWESWGYLNNVASGYTAIYNPKGLTISLAAADWAVGAKADAVIYIEDCDVNQNEIPDCSDEDVYLTASEGGGTTTAEDGDKDGIRDADEDNYGTDASMWDTDGDGMPDGWEALFADMDPLFYDAEEVADGDVMAYAEQAVTIVTVKNTAAGSIATNYILKAGESVPNVGDDADPFALYATYKYPVSADGKLVENYGRGAEVKLAAAAGTENRVTSVKAGTVSLVHAQVYEEYGFNPLTAVDATGAVNTKAFTALDKYLLIRYFETLGFTPEEQVNLGNLWSAYSLLPFDSDCDADGILDGWELYVMFGTDGIASAKDYAKPSETKVNPWNFDDRTSDIDGEQLPLIDEYDGGTYPTDPWNVDTEGSGVSDYYAQRYLLKGGAAGEDADGDGLSNYAEYLISEVFQFMKLDPTNPKTDDSCIDYFRKQGDLYVGEIFTDHDQTDDFWEETYGEPWANRYVYDPSRDDDDDGWSNWAEAKAGTDPRYSDTLGIDGYVCAEHPVPTIVAKVVYNGNAAITAPLVFQAWNERFDADMTSSPDAIWTVPTVTSGSTEGEESDTGSTSSAEKYVGVNPGKKITYCLGPGSVSPSSVKIYFRDTGYERAVVKDGVEVATYSGDSAGSSWYPMIQDVDGYLYTCITSQTVRVEVGTVNYDTGMMTLDFSNPALQATVYATMNNATANNTATDTDVISASTYYNCEKLDLAASHVKFSWTRSRVGTSVNGTFYLADADAVSDTAKSRGYLREGLNKFVAFADTDGDGAYTVGEPLGFAGGVDVGWQGGAFTIVLNETSPVFARLDIATGASDRETLYGSDSGNWTNLVTGALNGGTKQRVRVVRTMIDGWDTGVNGLNIDNVVVMDKELDLSVRSVLFEGDFVGNGEYDLDWSTFYDDVCKSPFITGWNVNNPDDPIYITNAVYRIVLGQGSVDPSETNNLLSVAIGRHFDVVRTTPSDLASAVVYGGHPKFEWTMNGLNSYTAFKIELYANSAKVWDSGYQLAMNAEKGGRYVWEAPICAGQKFTGGHVFGTSGAYTWRVTMNNAKYREDYWEDKLLDVTWGTLEMAVGLQQDVNDHGFGAIAAAVKYTGPTAVLAGTVRLQAFATGDFTGVPAAEAVVTHDVAEAGKADANAKLVGLAPGAYCVRAFIDTNGNGAKDDWESWGAAKEEVVVATSGTMPLVGVWIEDADTDGDWLPDAWEMQKAGDLDTKDATVSGTFHVSQSVQKQIKDTTLDAGVSTGMSGASLTVFNSDAVAKLVLGASDATTTLDFLRSQVQKKVNADTVKITSISLDPDGTCIWLGVGAETTMSVAGKTILKLYDFTTQPVKVTVKVYRKDSLAVADWGLPVLTTTAEIDSDDLNELVKVPIQDEIDFTSGFYKVEIEQ